MAQIKFGGGIADARGSVAGTVFSRNKHGAYMRNRTKPVNPNTVAQSLARARFASGAAEWTALTPAERATWNNLAAGASRLNALGEKYTPSGRQLFLESFNNMRLISAPHLTTAPINADIPAGIDPSVVLGADAAAGPPRTWDLLALSSVVIVSNMKIVVKATPPNPGPKTNFSNMYRVIGSFAPVATIDLVTAYETTFGPEPGEVGTPISVLISQVDEQTGFRSAELRLDVAIAPGTP